MSSTSTSQQTNLARRLAFIAVLLLALSMAVFLAQQVFTYRDFPFDADEANHALGSLKMARALQEGDFGRLVRLFYARDFYPPGFDWVKTLAFVTFGASAATARLVSVFSLFLAVLLIYALGLEFDERWGWLVGLVAALLTLTMQPLLINSALVMMEAPGLLITFALLYAYLRTIKRPSKKWLLTTSGLLILTFLTKYTYGVVATAVLLLMELSLLWPFSDQGEQESNLNGRSRLTNLLRRRWLWLFVPFLLAMLLWFGRSDKLVTFFDYTRPLADSEPWFAVQNILYYPRSIALHDTPAPWFALLTGASLLWALSQWRRPEVRLSLLYFLLGMAAIMLVNHPANPRFIVTFVPAAHLLTGAMIAWLLRRRQTAKGTASRFVLGLALALVALSLLLSIPLLVQRFTLIPSVMEAEVETAPAITDLYAWTAEQAPDAEGLFVINYWDQVSLSALSWHLAARNDAAPPVTVSGALLQPGTAIRTTALRENIQQSGATHVLLLEGGPWGAPVWPEYTAGLQDDLIPVARQRFTLELYDSDDWLERSLLTRSTWEETKQEGRYTLDVEAILYKLKDAGGGAES